MTKIEWTQRTWNPVVGCSRVSAGCEHCYAEGQVHRGMIERHKGLTVLPRDKDGKSLGKGARWTGEVRMVPEVLEVPLRRKKPTTWFVNSLSDLFHEKLVDSEGGRRFIAAIFAVMAATPQHTYQVLTKRPHKAAEWFAWLDANASDSKPGTRGCPHGWSLAGFGTDAGLPTRWAKHAPCDWAWPLPNVWIGTSVENQATADARIPELRKVPAAIRFLSCEPLLGPVQVMPGPNEGAWLKAHDHRLWHRDDPGVESVGGTWTMGGGIDWVIAGGESGPKARPMHPDWARSLRDQCVAAGVPFFFKQWGEYRHRDPSGAPDGGGDCIRVGKKAAGRELDGRTWDEYPEVK